MLRPVEYEDSRPDVDGVFCFERKLRITKKPDNHIERRANCVSELECFIINIDLFLTEFLFVYFGEGRESTNFPFWIPVHDYYKVDINTKFFLSCLTQAEVTLSLGEQSDEYRAFKINDIAYGEYVAKLPIPSNMYDLKKEHFIAEVAEYRVVSGDDYELTEYKYL